MSKAKNKRSKKAVKKAVRSKTTVKHKRLPAKELKKYKGLLLQERAKVDGGLSYIAKTTLNKSQRDASGDLSGYSYHMADMASDDYERDFSLGRATDEQKILYKIDEALKRIEDGSYGFCPQCSKAIAKKRLAALPFTELCIDCQKSNEVK
jgi:RNA polymerase-binding protein DksA